jgi:hypothetical protein
MPAVEFTILWPNPFNILSLDWFVDRNVSDGNHCRFSIVARQV